MDDEQRLKLQRLLREDKSAAIKFIETAFRKSNYTQASQAGSDDFVLALGMLAMAQGKAKSHLAASAGITRQHLHGLFKGEDCNPTIKTLASLLGSLGLEIHFKSKDQ